MGAPAPVARGPSPGQREWEGRAWRLPPLETLDCVLFPARHQQEGLETSKGCGFLKPPTSSPVPRATRPLSL